MSAARRRQPKRPFGFTETSRGWVSFDHADYNRAVVAGKASRNRCRFDVQITTDDLDRLLADATAPASLEGTLHCPGLGGALRGTDGTFRLLCPAPDARRRRLVYHLKVTDPRGRKLTISGFKVVEDTGHNSRWRDTTRLLLHVLAGHVDEGDERQNDPRLLAAGILVVTPRELGRTLVSIVRRSHRGWRALGQYALTFHSPAARGLSRAAGDARAVRLPGRPMEHHGAGRARARSVACAARTNGPLPVHRAVHDGRRPDPEPAPHPAQG